MRIAPAPATLLRAMAEERASASTSDRKAREREARARLDAADEKLLAVDLRFLDGEIDADTEAPGVPKQPGDPRGVPNKETLRTRVNALWRARTVILPFMGS